MACEESLRKIRNKFLDNQENLLDKKMMTLTHKFKFYEGLELKTLEHDLL
jgi:hypothetical protein